MSSSKYEGPLVSEPYVSMTVAMMRHWGARRSTEDASAVPHSGPTCEYRLCDYDIEPDASAASYFWAAAAITGGESRWRDSPRIVLQGDVRIRRCARTAWAAASVTATDYHRSRRPAARHRRRHERHQRYRDDARRRRLFRRGPTTIRNVAHIRHKETDRLTALATELRRVGAEVTEFADGMTITPGRCTAPRSKPTTIIAWP